MKIVNRFVKVAFVLVFVCMSVKVFALPSQVVVIRHSDKATENAGTNLDPTGYLRAVAFGEYYLQKFKTAPDAIIATNPTGNEGFREVQTVSPLAGHAESIKKGVIISHQFLASQVVQQAQDILSNPIYNGKNVLVCWDHGRMGILLNALGVSGKVVWKGKNYDTVYVLNFTQNGTGKPTVEWKRLDNQYPVPEVQNWTDYLDKMIPQQTPTK